MIAENGGEGGNTGNDYAYHQQAPSALQHAQFLIREVSDISTHDRIGNVAVVSDGLTAQLSGCSAHVLVRAPLCYCGCQ